MITAQQMGQMHLERPFKPFRVVMKNGDTYRVESRTQFFPAYDWILLPISADEDGVVIKSFETTYDQIDRVEYIEEGGRSAA